MIILPPLISASSKSNPNSAKTTQIGTNQRQRFSVSAIQEMHENGSSVVRGNPRISVADAAEFPLPDFESRVKPLKIRARTKKDYTQADQLEHRHEKRSTLYRALTTAGKILPNYVNKKGETRQHSVCLCRRYMQTHENAESHVTLSVNENNAAKFSSLIVCDNNWLCPVCSSIHLNKRAKEITEVQKNFLDAGHQNYWSTWMLTLTIPHSRSDKLDDLLTKKSAVMSDFHAHSAIKKLKQRIGWQGYVDSLEIRHSNANGWHPHHHILGFFTNMHLKTRVQCVYDRKRDYYRIATQADKKRGTELHKIEVQKYIYQIFAYLCVKNGLKRPSLEHGVDFRKSDDIQDYLTKQSKIAHELTAEHDKKSSYSRSQWEILRDCESVNDKLSSYSKALFLEFADAIKGKAKLHWSPDFKELWLNNGDDEDDEIGLKVDDESDNETSDKIYKISYEIWNRFFTDADRVHQRKLLEIAELDSLNNTSKTEIHLYALKKILADEKVHEQNRREKENDRLYEEWLARIPVYSFDKKYYLDNCH